MPTVKYSVSAYIADGTTTDYLITWDYLDDTHIAVSVGGVSSTDPAATHTFTKLNDTTVRVTDSIGGAIAAGLEIQVFRNTPISTRPISFADGSALLAADLNKNSDYLLFSMQEALDQVDFSVQYQIEAEGFRDATQTLQLAASASQVAAAASQVAAAASEAASATDAATVASNLAAAAASETAAELAETNAETAQSAAETAAALATTNGAAQVTLATTQAGLATTNGAAQVTLATTQAALATTNGAAQVTLATTQAALATTNGAAQVTLATTQATNSATSAGESASSAAASLASSTSSNGKAVEALASANNAASSATAAASSEAAAVAASSSVNSNIAAINSVNSNINSVNTVSGSIANVNVVAGSISSVNAFGNQYEVSATEPSSPNEGLLWFDTSVDIMKVYDGSAFQNAGSSVNGTVESKAYTVGTNSGTYAGSLTTFPATYDSGYVHTWLNGVKLVDGVDFTATGGSNIVLNSAAATGDVVSIVAYGTFLLADHYSKTAVDALIDDVETLALAGM